VNTVAVVHSDLDDRIAAAFADGAKSSDVAALIKHTERAAKSAVDAAERARKSALDPALSANDVADARRAMDDAAFKRDRLQAAVTRLGERLEQLKEQEENARHQAAYDKARVERDQLVAELTELYPAVAPKLADLVARVAANDREIYYINRHTLPKGAAWLLEAELIARGLPDWVSNYVHAPRITDLLCLPPWYPRSDYFWPRRVK
jgi:hypothetical protein